MLRLAAGGAALLAAISAAPSAALDPDQRLVAQVRQLIAGQRQIRVYDWVTFLVEGSSVKLSGAVTRASLSDRIERSVLALEAVSQVVNELRVLPHAGEDIGIRMNAYWRIYGHPELRRYANRDGGFEQRLRRAASDTQLVLLEPVHILVEDSHLTLEGELEQRRERRVVENQARAVVGVRSITNNIVVTGTDTEELEPIDFEMDPWWADSESLAEPVVRVENRTGSVRVTVAATDRVRLRRSSRNRQVRDGDTQTTRLGLKTRIRALPSDGATIDLDIDLPYGHRLEVETIDGAIELAGLVRSAQVKTMVGPVRLTLPWKAVRLDVRLGYRPRELSIPGHLRASLAPLPEPRGGAGNWALEDIRPGHQKLYGLVRIRGRQPDALTLLDGDIPADSPVRMHWQAPAALRRMLMRPTALRLTDRGRGDGPAVPPVAGTPGKTARFTSDVRLVQLSASVVDGAGRPVPGLVAEDFEVREDGDLQRLSLVHDGRAAFNLVLLLDCSTSTLVDRKAVLEAARQFVMTARPGDQVAIYVLSDAFLQVVSPLTADQGELLERIEHIPRLSGGTPLYDAIALSYAQELAERRWDRNAIIVISDGMDNDLLPRRSRSVPSTVPFDDLLRAASEINGSIYPIFLEPEAFSVRVERSWRERQRQSTDRARERMRKLAEMTGGRLFPAGSIRDLDGVYAQVAEELRSVYTLAYYPSNQDFDGEWRGIRVGVPGDSVRVRTRPGYYGH